MHIKKIYLILFILIIPALLMLFSYHTGSPGGRTGSPGDNGKNCTQCHAGTPQNADGWITSNIPPSGYIGGETYVITATGTHPGVQRFGFEITAEDELGNKTGTLTLVNSSETKFTNAGKAVTHTAQGITPIGISRSWQVEWTAPEEIPGDIIFYAAFNAANGNGSSSGDVIYLSDLTVSADIIGIAEPESHPHLYPNPASGVVSICVEDIQPGQTIRIFTRTGQLTGSYAATGSITRLDLSNLPRGIYLIRTGGTDETTQKLVLR